MTVKSPLGGCGLTEGTISLIMPATGCSTEVLNSRPWSEKHLLIVVLGYSVVV